MLLTPYHREAESAGSVETGRAIVTETIGLDIEDEDRKVTWIEDAEAVWFCYFSWSLRSPFFCCL